MPRAVVVVMTIVVVVMLLVVWELSGGDDVFAVDACVHIIESCGCVAPQSKGKSKGWTVVAGAGATRRPPR